MELKNVIQEELSTLMRKIEALDNQIEENKIRIEALSVMRNTLVDLLSKPTILSINDLGDEDTRSI